jgi:acyl-CoA synthetase (AMP-forming)/AMP-acid ligase II
VRDSTGEIGSPPSCGTTTHIWKHIFGIPAAGGVLHTLNLRLAPTDIAYIANHGGARFLILDDILLPLYEKFRSSVQFERVFVVPLTGEAISSELVSYEDFLRCGSAPLEYPRLDENEAASMCYTSGTTGVPKGVVYTHRSVFLHTFLLTTADNFAIRHADVLLPVVSMFHVNGWGLPYAAAMVGCKLVLPGPHLDPESLLENYQSEHVTVAAGVPTIWLNMLEHLEKNPGRWKVPPMRLLVGGASPPPAVVRKLAEYGIHLHQGWGLTESSPQATANQLKSHMKAWPDEQRYAVESKAGIPVPLVDVRVVNESGEVPRDDQTMGEVQLRGPWVAASYYNLPEQDNKWTEDGWFRTGDVATIDQESYLRIVDRTKDLIKSGGEWISSVDLENALVAHPDVREAAVIAVAHPKWLEHLIAILVVSKARKSQEKTRAPSWRRTSRSGSYRTRSCSWTSCLTPQLASSTRRCCASAYAKWDWNDSQSKA